MSVLLGLPCSNSCHFFQAKAIFVVETCIPHNLRLLMFEVVQEVIVCVWKVIGMVCESLMAF